jgi:hypothetical protein
VVRRWSESCDFEFEFWILIFVWNLVLGAWNLFGACSLKHPEMLNIS